MPTKEDLDEENDDGIYRTFVESGDELEEEIIKE